SARRLPARAARPRPAPPAPARPGATGAPARPGAARRGGRGRPWSAGSVPRPRAAARKPARAAGGRARGCRWPPRGWPRLSRPPRSLVARLPQQRVVAGAGVALLAHQHVQGQAGEVVGDRLHELVLVLVEDLAVAAAALAGLGLDRLRSALDVVVGDALGLRAVR